MYLAQDKVHCQALDKTVMNFWVLQMAWNILSSWGHLAPWSQSGMLVGTEQHCFRLLLYLRKEELARNRKGNSAER